MTRRSDKRSDFALRPQLAALVGIGAATAFNFVATRYLVFRSSHIRPPAGDVDSDKLQEPGAKGTGTD
jgi:hypothetical protein